MLQLNLFALNDTFLGCCDFSEVLGVLEYSDLVTGLLDAEVDELSMVAPLFALT